MKSPPFSLDLVLPSGLWSFGSEVCAGVMTDEPGWQWSLQSNKVVIFCNTLTALVAALGKVELKSMCSAKTQFFVDWMVDVINSSI